MLNKKINFQLIRWWSGPWQHCNSTCDENGLRRRSVLCVRSLSSDEEVALRNSECNPILKPTDTETCVHHKPCLKDNVNSAKIIELNDKDCSQTEPNCTKHSEPKLFCMTASHLCNDTNVRTKCFHTCRSHH